MATKFTPAPEVADLAADLIRQHHQHLISHAVRVEYLFRDDTPQKGGKDVWGTCQKVTSLNAYLAADEGDQEEGETPPFFAVTISQPVWERLTPAQRLALVDHELSHAWAEEDKEGATKLSILPHDLEEFQGIVARHGLWKEDLKDFAATCDGAQPTLPLEDDDDRVTITAAGRSVETTAGGLRRAAHQIGQQVH